MGHTPKFSYPQKSVFRRIDFSQNWHSVRDQWCLAFKEVTRKSKFVILVTVDFSEFLVFKNHRNNNKYLCKNLSYKTTFTNFLISVKFCLVLDALPVSVSMPYRMGQKFKPKSLVNIFTKYWWILPILSVLYPANNFQWRFMTNLTTPKVCGYTTLKNNWFQKLCRWSSVTSYPTCAYWRECKHNLKLKHKLNFWPILYDSIVLLCLQTLKVYLKLKVNFNLNKKISRKSFQKISFCIRITVIIVIFENLYFTR